MAERNPAPRHRSIPALLTMLLTVPLPAPAATSPPSPDPVQSDPAPPKASPFSQARQRRIAEQLDAKPALAETYRQCPADVFRANAPFWRRFLDNASTPYQLCEQDPEHCLDQCFRWHSGAHCFGLAQAFQYNAEKPRTNHHTEMLYAEACAAGDGAGCVNRAAGIRNGGMPDDPYIGQTSETRQLCEYRSFRIGCDGNDAWGCAMLGQSYARAEGVPADPGQARRFYSRSCQISPNFVACDFARKGLADLDANPLSSKPDQKP